jgi:hypothetical protein
VAILAAFDSLVGGGQGYPLARKQPDKEYPHVLWDVAGDEEERWLYVVATNTRTNVRFGAVTDRRGRWPVCGQICGINAEANDLGRQLADEIMANHKKELMG